MPRPGLTVVITPDPPRGYAARFAGAKGQRVGRGPTEGAAVDDLMGRGVPGKGLHPPGMREAAEGSGEDG